MYIWVPPYSKIHFCHSGTKFHISWLPSNIGLEMSNIFVNSDAQYIWGFQIAFNRWIGMFLVNKYCIKRVLSFRDIMVAQVVFCKNMRFANGIKKKRLWKMFSWFKNLSETCSPDIFGCMNHVFYHPYHTVPEWQNGCFCNVTAKIYHEDNITEYWPSEMLFWIQYCS